MALRPTKGMLTGSGGGTKRMPGETDPFDPNAMNEDDINMDGGGPGVDLTLDQLTRRYGNPVDPVATTVNDPIELPPDEGDLRQRLYDLFNTGFRWADIAEIWGSGEESLEEILDRIAGNIDVPPEDSTQAREILGQYVTEAFDRAQDIVNTMVDNPEELADMEDPGELTKLFIEQGGMSFCRGCSPCNSCWIKRTTCHNWWGWCNRRI